MGNGLGSEIGAWQAERKNEKLLGGVVVCCIGVGSEVACRGVEFMLCWDGMCVECMGVGVSWRLAGGARTGEAYVRSRALWR